MLQSLKDALPATDDSVTDWIFLLMGGYVVADILVAFVVWTVLGRAKYSLVNAVSNSILFATSLLLVGGALNEPTLVALGSLTTYLLFAGFVGAGFAVQEALAKRVHALPTHWLSRNFPAKPAVSPERHST